MLRTPRKQLHQTLARRTLPLCAVPQPRALLLSRSRPGRSSPRPPSPANFRTLLVGVDHRTTVSLDGDGHSLVVQSPGRALYGANGAINDKGYAQIPHPNISTGPHNEEYDFSTAPTLHVPGDWNTQVPQLFNYEGVVWYQRDFNADPKPNTRTFLHIGAANYRSHVWVNQKRVCDHEGGYTPFDCEVTAVLLSLVRTSSSSPSTPPASSAAFPPSASTG